MTDVTYTDKVAGASDATGKFSDDDANEIKTAVNSKQDIHTTLTAIIAGTYPNLINDAGTSTGTVLSASKIIELIAAAGGTGGYVDIPDYSDSTGTVGQWSFDAVNDYVYICKATDTWDRYTATFLGWDNPTPSSSLLIDEDFSETGTPTDPVPTVTGTIDFDYATAPASVGDECMSIDLNAAAAATWAFTESAEVYIAFRYALTATVGSALMYVTDISGTALGHIDTRNSAGEFRVYGGSAFGPIFTANTSLDTFYYAKMRIKYVDGAGNDEIEAWFSDDGTWTDTAATHLDTVLVTLGDSPGKIIFYGVAGQGRLIDDLKVSTSDIGDY